MLRARRLVFPLLLVLLVFTQVAAAAAAPSGWKAIDITLQTEQQQSMLIISGQLPETVKLPHVAELAVPAGTQLQWVGEILGGDPSADPELKYEKSTANGMDVYRFTMTRARIAQVEGVLPSVTAFDGTNYATSLKWTAWESVPEVRISQRLPQGAQVVQAAADAELQTGDSGTSYYAKKVTSPKAGDAIDLTFSYAVPSAPVRSGAGKGGPTSVPLIVMVVTAVLGFGFLVFAANRKSAASRMNEDAQPVKLQETQADETFDDESADGGDQTPVGGPPSPLAPRKQSKSALLLLVIAAVFVAGFFLAVKQSTSSAVVNGSISRNFGTPSACQSATFAYTANDGVDLSKQGAQIMKAFEGMDGVGVITLDLEKSTLDMSWCDSSQSEQSMRDTVTSTGLIVLGEATVARGERPAEAMLDPSGKKQTLAVDTSSGSFAPSQIVLKAGVPAEITFGKAVGCLSEVAIADLGVRQDLTKGPATVKLPALTPGTHSFVCGMGHQSGQIIVQ